MVTFYFNQQPPAATGGSKTKAAKKAATGEFSLVEPLYLRFSLYLHEFSVMPIILSGSTFPFVPARSAER